MQKLIFLVILSFFIFATHAFGATLHVEVRDTSGKKVKEAVVYAIPHDGFAISAPTPDKATIDQIDKEFVPNVSAVHKGTEVFFPNHDQIRHHVYSFSEPKNFEIPLYRGLPSSPVVFDQPGIVVIGCNIHDWMKAYIFVSETPLLGISDENGNANIGNLPKGSYDVQIWHPNLKGNPGDQNKVVTIAFETDDQNLVMDIEQKKNWKTWRAPTAAPRTY